MVFEWMLMTHCLSPPNLWNDSRIQRRPWPSAWKKISFKPSINSLVSMQSRLKIHCFHSSTEWMHGFRLVAGFNSCWSQLEGQETQTQPRCVSCNEQAAAAASWASCQQQLYFPVGSSFLPHYHWRKLTVNPKEVLFLAEWQTERWRFQIPDLRDAAAAPRLNCVSVCGYMCILRFVHTVWERVWS